MPVKLLCLGLCPFHVKQFLFLFHSPAIPPHVSTFAYHTMTGDRHSGSIRCACPRNSTRGVGLMNCFGHFAVRTSLAEGNGLQIGPHLSLKRSRLNIERQLRVQFLSFHLT